MTFDEYADRQAHQAEIAATRVGFLGGSDAALAYHITECGVAGLSNTDIKRLKVLFGCIAPTEWGGNRYTECGHDFEDYIAHYLPTYMGVQAEREKVLSGKRYAFFSTQAHADFCTADGVVYECKCVANKSTEKVLKKYYAQLQWYYMLGARMVYLVHGAASKEIADIVLVEKNDGYIALMEKGCGIIDGSVEQVCSANTNKNVIADDLPDSMRVLLSDYSQLTQQIQELDDRRNEIKEKIGNYMGEYGISNIEGECSVSITKKTVVRKIKMSEVLQDFPQVADDKYYEFQERKPSVMFRIR